METSTVTRYWKTRFFAVYDATDALVCVRVYRRGALVARRAAPGSALPRALWHNSVRIAETRPPPRSALHEVVGDGERLVCRGECPPCRYASLSPRQRLEAGAGNRKECYVNHQGD
jgi:hypothetical protein